MADIWSGNEKQAKTTNPAPVCKFAILLIPGEEDHPLALARGFVVIGVRLDSLDT